MKRLELDDNDLLDLAATGRVLDIPKLVEVAFQKTLMGARTKHRTLNNKFSVTSGMVYVKSMHPERLPGGVKDMLEKKIQAVHDKQSQRHKKFWKGVFVPPGKLDKKYEEARNEHWEICNSKSKFDEAIGERSRFFKAMVVDIEKLYLKEGLKPPKIEILVCTGPTQRFGDDSMDVVTQLDGSIRIRAKMPSDVPNRVYFNNRLVLFGVSYWQRPVVFDLAVKRGKNRKVLKTTLRTAQPAEHGHAKYTYATNSEVFVLQYLSDRGAAPITKLKAKKVQFRMSNYDRENETTFQFYKDHNDRRVLKRLFARFTNEGSRNHEVL
jgi:hypothetical protein